MRGAAFVHDVAASPNIEPRKHGLTPRLLILHYTGMKSAEAARAWLADPHSRVSCHYLVDESGRITQMVDEGMRAWHAGVSSWKGERDINSLSIGIEMQNPGHSAGYPDFPARQMAAVAELGGDIAARHAMPPHNVLGHSDIAPQRKIDPGEKFDWKYLHGKGVGHWVEPVAIGDDQGLRLGDAGEAVMALQAALRAYGYEVGEDGVFDEPCRQCVCAFQRHFRPARVDGAADRSTVETLRRLRAALA